MAAKVKLSHKNRTILEAHGVIEAPVVPPTEKLAEAIAERGGRYQISGDAEGGSFARVYLGASWWDGAGDQPHVALCNALCPALSATQHLQADMFGETEQAEPNSSDADADEATVIEVGMESYPALPLGELEDQDEEPETVALEDADASDDLVDDEEPPIGLQALRPVEDLTLAELEERRIGLEVDLGDITYSDRERAAIGQELDRVNAEWKRRSEAKAVQEPTSAASPEERSSTTKYPPIGIQQMTPDGYSKYRNFEEQFRRARGTEKERPASQLEERKAELERRLASIAVRPRNIEPYRIEIQAITEELALRALLVPEGVTSDANEAAIAGEQLADVVAQNGGTVEAVFGAEAFVEISTPLSAIAVADDLMNQAFGGRHVVGQRVSSVPAVSIDSEAPIDLSTIPADYLTLPGFAEGEAVSSQRIDVARAIKRQRPKECLERMLEIERALARPDTRSHVARVLRAELELTRQTVADDVHQTCAIGLSKDGEAFVDPDTGEIMPTGRVLSRYSRAILELSRIPSDHQSVLI